MKRIALLFAMLLAGAVVFGGSASGGPTSGSYIVVLEKGASVDSVLGQHASLAGVEVEHTYRHALKGYAATLSPQALATVRADSRVDFVSPDRVVRATAQTLPTGINRIDGELSTARCPGNGSGSVNVNVAVVDTGIDPTHPDLNVVGGKDCAPGIGFNDLNGHGSHVAGTIAAKDDANGVVGVAPGARLWAVKVLTDAGAGLTSDIVCGIDWVTSTRSDLDPNNNIAVANMSLGGGGSDDGNCGNSNNDAEHRAICNAVAGRRHLRRRGRERRRRLPQLDARVLRRGPDRVGRDRLQRHSGRRRRQHLPHRTDDRYASYSNFAVLAADQNHTIAAPGTCINSTWMLGGYNTISGTSMASPHVAGVGRALHLDRRLHGHACADRLEAPRRRAVVHDGGRRATASTAIRPDR